MLLKNGFLTNFYSLETLKFVVTTNWLQLSTFSVWNPVVKTKPSLLYRNPKVVNCTKTLTAS